MINYVLFDFDGTITKLDTTKILISELLKNRPSKIFFVTYLMLMMFFSKKNNMESFQKYKNRIIGFLVSGLSVDKLDKIIDRFKIRVKSFFRRSLLEIITDHIKNNNKVLVVTASPTFAVEACLEDLSIEVIGVDFEIIDDHYTGNYNNSCYGEKKVQRIMELLEFYNQDFCFIEAWSDCFSDIGMIDLANKKYWIGNANMRKRVNQSRPNDYFIEESHL